jgi:hypothetical protein
MKMLNKEQWVQLMRNAGLDDEMMHRWHREFEKMAPGEHEEFLEILQIPEDEIARIKTWSA